MIRLLIRQILEEKGFLRLHRAEDKLYVTDFPLRCPKAACEKRLLLENAGFIITPDEKNTGLWQIDMTEEKWANILLQARFAPACPQGHAGLASLEKLFSRFDTENIPIARMLLKASGQKIPDPDKLWRKICAQYALCLRHHAPRPGKGCAGLLRQCMKGMAG